VLETLHRAVIEALNTSQVQEAFRKQIMRAVPTKSPEEAKAWLRSEIDAWTKIVDEVKIDLTD